ncbi:ATP-binding protein [Amycolatopsis azurea]|uniref:ATP-binding protein n=1 Tax=Amycolatopsis azurea TaxID=36819 RepID=UPI001FD77A3B|nr:ATP-binding protein [Amycolatopsis azurea]
MLVGNALRHGAQPVRVRVSTSAAKVYVEVTDHSRGLSEEVLPHVFDRFYKADTGRARTPGNGLGLAIAKENPRAHDGDLDAYDITGAGARFVLELPPESGGQVKLLRALAACSLLAGCGVSPDGPTPGGDAPTGVAPGVTLYFVDAQQRLQPDERRSGRLGSIADALALLFSGAAPGQGLHTEIALSALPPGHGDDRTRTHPAQPSPDAQRGVAVGDRSDRLHRARRPCAGRRCAHSESAARIHHRDHRSGRVADVPLDQVNRPSGQEIATDTFGSRRSCTSIVRTT